MKNIRLVMKTLTLLLALFTGVTLTAQPTDCLSFENLTVGTQYGAPAGQSSGDIIYSEFGVNVRAEAFSPFVGQPEFGSATVGAAENFTFALAAGNILHTQGLNLRFDFSDVAGDVFACSFDYIDITGRVNVSSENGNLLLVGETVSELISNVTPYDEPTDLIEEAGSIFYQGTPLTQISIGGESLAIDNFCVYLDDEICTVLSLNFAAPVCNPDGSFNLGFNLEANSIGNAGFTVSNDGTPVANFFYGETEYVLQNIDGDGATEHSLTLTDNQLECELADFELGIVDCSDACAIAEVILEYQSCTEADLGTYLLDFNYDDVPSEEFVVNVDGIVIGTYNYTDLPVVISLPTTDTAPVVEIADETDFSCFALADYAWQYCGVNSCNIVTSIHEIICEGDDFYLVIGTDGGGYYEAGYSTFINGEFIESIPPGFSHPDTIGPIAGGAEDYNLTLTANAFPSCTFDLYVGTVDLTDCTFDQMNCTLTITDIAFSECENGEFFINFAVDTAYVHPSDSFELYVSVFTFFGLQYSYDAVNFAYDEGPYTIGPYSTNQDTSYLLTVRDQVLDFACANTFPEYIFPPDCEEEDCAVSDLSVTFTDCTEAGLTDIVLDFSVENTTATEFILQVGGIELPPVSLSSLPLTVLDVPALGGTETISVCLVDAEECCAELQVTLPDCSGLTVWPGDANNDNISNNFDVINLGLAFMSEGAMRAETGTLWQAYTAVPWAQAFPDGLNHTYADTDGNGIIDLDDLAAVEQNYNLTHGTVTPYTEIDPTLDSPNLFVDMPDDFEVAQGETLDVPITAGSLSNQIESIYGLAFTIKYDPEMIDPTTVQSEYPISWFGVPQTNVITFDRHDPAAGEIDVTLVRNDHNNTSGFGQIMSFIGVVDNIAGKAVIDITIENVYAVTKSGERLAFNKPTESAAVISALRNVQAANGFSVFPNPAGATAFVQSANGGRIEEIVILDVNGKVTARAVDVAHISVAGLTAGVYWLRCRAGEETGILRLVRL